jgi:hypothetical protein
MLPARCISNTLASPPDMQPQGATRSAVTPHLDAPQADPADGSVQQRAPAALPVQRTGVAAHVYPAPQLLDLACSSSAPAVQAS